jgi:hypothetical protein
MNLDESQKQKVTAWIAEGQTVSEIQRRLVSEFGLQMTYLDVRLLLDDLRLKPKDKEPPATAPKTIQPQAPGPGGVSSAGPTDAVGNDLPSETAVEGEAVAGHVSVTVDKVTRPGALVSGNVAFSDGNNASWHLDQMGRLGLMPQTKGYRPSEDDLLAFQTELQQQLARMGY